MTTDTEMLPLFRAELELCRVESGDVVAVLTQGGTRMDYAEAFLRAALDLGATAFQVNAPAPMAGPPDSGAHCDFGLAGNQPAIDALKLADIVIDLMGLLWSPEQKEITDSGTRMLLVREPLDVLRRMFPTADLRHRVEIGAGLIAEAKEIRITSPAGTDLTYALGQYRVLTEYGYTDTPGRWDHWPGGLVATCANEEGVRGTAVINTGDIIYYPCVHYVRDPITLRIERAYITEIEGDGLDAEFLRDYIKRWDDPRAYAVSHIGWGLNERALWDYIATSRSGIEGGAMDGRAFYGNVLFSTGPNVEFDGTNDTPCHLDMPLKGCSLWLDGRIIVDNGDIVPEELQSPAR